MSASDVAEIPEEENLAVQQDDEENVGKTSSVEKDDTRLSQSELKDRPTSSASYLLPPSASRTAFSSSADIDANSRSRPTAIQGNYSTASIPTQALEGGSAGRSSRAASKTPSRSLSRSVTSQSAVQRAAYLSENSSRGEDSSGDDHESSRNQGYEGGEADSRNVPQSATSSRLLRPGSQAGLQRSRTAAASAVIDEKDKEKEKKKRDKGEELIRQRQMERKKAKKLAMARRASQMAVYQGYGDEDEAYHHDEQGHDMFPADYTLQQQQGRAGKTGYSVPSTPAMQASGPNTPAHPSTARPDFAGRQSVRSKPPPVPDFSLPDPASSTYRDQFPAPGGTAGQSESEAQDDQFPDREDTITPRPSYDAGTGSQSAQRGSTSASYAGAVRGSPSLERRAQTPRMGSRTPTFSRHASEHGQDIQSSPFRAQGGEATDTGFAPGPGSELANSVIDQVVSEMGDREAASQAGHDDADDEEEEEDEDADDEGVTMRDRQDVSDVVQS